MIGKGSVLNKKIQIQNGKAMELNKIIPSAKDDKNYKPNYAKAIKIATDLGGKFIKE